MELSAELLHSLAHLKGDQIERREQVRAPLRLRLRIIPYDHGTAGEPVDVWTRDVSASGIGILSSSPMAAGRKFIVSLPRLDEPPLYLVCTVRNCAEMANRLYAIGASFAEVAGRARPHG
jgi:c-di-GMP-binding flagellar brake protein YcgR